MASEACPSVSSRKRKIFLKDHEIPGVIDEELDYSGEESDIEISGSDYEECDSDSNHSADSDSETNDSDSRINNLDMSWTTATFTPKIFNFIDAESGVKSDQFDDNSKEVDYFISLLTPEIVEFIVQETNRYAGQKLQTDTLTPSSYLRKWKDTDISEMYVFFALMMLNSCNRKRDMKLQWSTDPLLHTPVFSRTMPRDRFFSILSMLHFSNNEQNQGTDRLYKVHEVLKRIKRSFSIMFQPFQDLVIDESMVLFKGRLIFKQYIRTKRHRFGIKLFVLCDCETGYVLDYIVYTGSQTEIDNIVELGVTGSVVTTLMKPYLNKGHTLFTDNYYTSPTLSVYLHERKTNSCGTVRQNRKFMPPLQKKLQTGEKEAKATNTLLAVKWKDRREVTILTTKHKDEMVTLSKKDRKTNQFRKKPSSIVEYNEKMGAIDRSDMMLSNVECMRKSIKWYRKLFFHTVDLCLLNAHALYLTRTGKKISLSKFQLEIVRQLLARFHTPNSLQKKGRPSAGLTPLRLTERHFPSLVPPTEKRKNAMRKCIVCTNTKIAKRKRKESRVMCEPCDVGLCTVPCFQIYHTKEVF